MGAKGSTDADTVVARQYYRSPFGNKDPNHHRMVSCIRDEIGACIASLKNNCYTTHKHGTAMISLITLHSCNEELELIPEEGVVYRDFLGIQINWLLPITPRQHNEHYFERIYDIRYINNCLHNTVFKPNDGYYVGCTLTYTVSNNRKYIYLVVETPSSTRYLS